MTHRFRRNRQQDASEEGRDAVKGLPGPLFIKDLIRHVDAELRSSQAERTASGQAPIFEVNDLVLEVNFVATKSADAKGGIAFHIITVGADASPMSASRCTRSHWPCRRSRTPRSRTIKRYRRSRSTVS